MTTYGKESKTTNPNPGNSSTTVGNIIGSGKLDPDEVPAMAVVNTQELGVMIRDMHTDMQKMMDPESRAQAMQQAAVETNTALAQANNALQTGQATLELAKDVEPLMTQMKAMNAKLELLDTRMQAIEKKSSICSIS